MNQVYDISRASLDTSGEFIELLLNFISLLFIVVGVISSLFKSVQQRRHGTGIHPFHTYFRIMFGGWLVVALEFLLAADIVGSIISPTKSHLIELAVIAFIRTFLNYFLNKELQEERALSSQH
jgi:uncharacterized membrane protein